MAWLENWDHRKKITIDADEIGSTLTNYPLHIRLQDDAGILAAANSDGSDLRVTAADGETVLDYNLLAFDRSFTRDGVWTWYNDSRAVYSSSANATFIGYVTSGGIITIGKYDHGSGVWSKFDLRTFGVVDDHDNPSIVELADGKIMVAYTGHNTSTVYTRVSTSAGDISAWEDEVLLPSSSGDYSYSHLFQFSNGDIIVFYRLRISGVERDTRYRVSADGGATWGAEKRLFYVATERPYFKAVQVGDTIHCCSTTSQPNEVPLGDNDLHYYRMEYNDGVPTFHTADGTEIGDEGDLPLGPGDVDVVFDATASGDNAWNWDIKADGSGNIAIVYTLSDTTAADDAVVQGVYRWAYWDGASWTNADIATTGGVVHNPVGEPYYYGGVCIDSQSLTTVYCVRPVDGQMQLFRYVTADGGSSWTPTQLTFGGEGKKGRPFHITNGHADCKVVFWQGEYFDFNEGVTRVRCWPGNLGDHIDITLDAEIPSVSSSVDTDAYLYYGKEDAEDASDAGETYENLLFQTYGDLTNQTAGALDLASKSAVTFESMYEARLFGATRDETIWSNWSASATTVASFLARFANSANAPFEIVYINSSGQVAQAFADLLPTAEQNQHVAAVFDGSGGECRAYLDGVVSASTPSFTAFDADASAVGFTIGNTAHTTNSYFDGAVKMVRVWDEVKSADWLAASASNLNDPGSFSTLGSEEDVERPELSDPSGTATGTTTATLTVTTDFDNGTLYAYVSESALEPGDMVGGMGAAFHDSEPVSETGEVGFSATGLAPGTTYYAHFMHRDTNNVDSLVVTSDAFTTDESPVSGGGGMTSRSYRSGRLAGINRVDRL